MPTAMRDQYMSAGKGFLFVYSITTRSSFAELQYIRTRLYKVKDKDSSEPVPIVIAGNKSDLAAQRQVSAADGNNLAAEWKCPFMETSALNRSNVDNVFFELVRMVRKYESGAKPKQSSEKRKKCTLL
eukprot:TRINITY_DN2358_c0_g1_i1.p3 TRINITY_DN2358_c0_g1~~TRINITY_DN2358_c0_g1_i1.p3  ORF type:complete len:128 (+),score=31.45 TRINITY_DN2358_c0_g1_i1:448-831(+)